MKKHYRLNTKGKIIFSSLLICLGCLGCLKVNSVCKDRTFGPMPSIVYAEDAYIAKPEIEVLPEVELYKTLPVLTKSSAKTYEDYRLITCKSSKQYDMIFRQKLFTVRDDGFLITDDGFFAVALGSYFGELGNKYIFITDNGNEIPVIMTDLKQDRHTDKNNFAGSNAGDILEFMVDSSKMPTWKNGYKYGGNFNNIEWLSGNIIEIRIVE